MPTVLRKNGFRFQIYTDDHEPAHTHVFKAGKQVVINLGDDQHRVSVRENKNMGTKNVVKALEIAADYQGYLLEKWREFHG
ncbi:MAG: DUF4160 domain-containing protein [Blastocatellia bacterium]